VNYDEALIAARNGDAIIFFGAGFSYGLKSSLGKTLPTGRELSKILCREIKIPEIDDLKTSARHFIKKKNEEELISLLKGYFEINEVDEIYDHITNIPWRSVYTTNYDHAFETSAKKNNIDYISVDMESNPRDTAGKKRVIHINGHINNISADNLQTSFKLTNESYLTEQFRISAWSASFKRDVNSAHAIFFVGYSLYDMDIQEILYAEDSIANKTFFIERDDLTFDEISNSVLSDFGTIHNIGIKKFSEDLKNVDPLAVGSQNELIITSFDNVIISESDSILNDSDVYNLFHKGDIKQNLLIDDFLAKSNKYIVHRNDLNIALENLNSKENLIIHSGLANGKTIIAKQIAAHYLSVGYKVFELKDEYLTTYAYKEIENIIKKYPQTLFIIESYTENIEIIDHINTNRQPDVKLLLTSRTHEHERSENEIYYSKKIIDITKTTELSLDKLTQQDLLNIIDFFEYYGLWGKRTEFSDQNNIQYLTHQANSEYHGILLGLFESSQVVSLLEGFFKEMAESKILMNHIIAVLCLSITNISKPSFHMVSALTNSSAIFEPSLRKNNVFQQILTSNNSSLFAKSSILAEFILTKFPNSPLLVSSIIEIAKNARIKGQGSDLFLKFYRDLASFRYIERILPKKGKRESLILFYQGLRDIPQERENPHFWLQYAMARLSFPDADNLSNAKLHLEAALGKAKKRQNFWTDDIETQYARYYLLNAINTIQADNTVSALNELNSSINLILTIHRKKRQKKAIYRPIKLILIFFNKFKGNLNLHELNIIESQCNDLQELFKIDDSKFGNDVQFRIARENIDTVIRQIKVMKHVKEN